MGKKKKNMQKEKAQNKSAKKHSEENSVKNLNEPGNNGDDNMDKMDDLKDMENVEDLEEGDAGESADTKEKDPGISTEEMSPEIIMQEKIREKEEKYLRLVAEFDNYRKRTLREKAELTKLAGEDLITGLLPVIDDFDRAIESMDSTENTEAIKKGIDLIYTKLREFLKQKGVKEIQAMGEEFDTDLHEAVTKIPAGSKKDKGKVMDVIEKGYLLHDKVIRYAKVVIGE